MVSQLCTTTHQAVSVTWQNENCNVTTIYSHQFSFIQKLIILQLQGIQLGRMTGKQREVAAHTCQSVNLTVAWKAFWEGSFDCSGERTMKPDYRDCLKIIGSCFLGHRHELQISEFNSDCTGFSFKWGWEWLPANASREPRWLTKLWATKWNQSSDRPTAGSSVKWWKCKNVIWRVVWFKQPHPCHLEPYSWLTLSFLKLTLTTIWWHLPCGKLHNKACNS